MLQLANLLPTGDFVVTLGARGCLVFVRATMSVWLVALRKARASLVQAHLRPERINGTGDAFLTEFVAGHAHFCRAAGRPAVAAALAASVTMAHRLAPSLPAEESWFDVRPLAGKDQCA